MPLLQIILTCSCRSEISWISDQTIHIHDRLAQCVETRSIEYVDLSGDLSHVGTME